MDLNTIQCMDAVQFLQSLPDDSVDMGIASPPYDNLRNYDGHSEFDFETIAQQSYRVLKPGGVLVWVVGDATINGSETLTSMRQALYFVDVVGFKMHDTMIDFNPGTTFPDPSRYTQQWQFMFVLSKGKPITKNLLTRKNKWSGDRRPPGSLKFQQEANGTKSKRIRKPVKEFGTLGNVWKLDRGNGKSTKDKEAFKHPAIFPEKLAERHILTWSNSGEIILDYFMGSGTTAKLARKHSRNYIGCDINPDYVQLSQERLSKPYTMTMEL